MEDVISKAIALGLGLGVTGKEQVEKIVAEVQKQAGISKKESRQFIKNVMKKGGKVRKDLDKQIAGMVDNAIDTVCPVTRKEFNELKKQVAAKKKPRKTTRKKTAKKTAKRA